MLYFVADRSEVPIKNKVCYECHKRFYDTSTLKKDIKAQHAGKLQCKTCKLFQKDKQYLVDIHMKECIPTCDVCKKQFLSVSKRDDHQKTHR